jgi:hypothetical protein
MYERDGSVIVINPIYSFSDLLYDLIVEKHWTLSTMCIKKDLFTAIKKAPRRRNGAEYFHCLAKSLYLYAFLT